MEDDTTRWGKSLPHGDIPSAAVRQVGSKSEAGPENEASLVEASSRQPRRGDVQQERPSSSGAGYADMSSKNSSCGVSAAMANADSENPATAVSGHGWPVDDLDLMFDAVGENDPLPESLPAHTEVGKSASRDATTAVDGVHNITTAAVHDIDERSSPTRRRPPASPRAAVSASEHDDWKDYSCATPWEYFVNDVGNAMGVLESREAVVAGVARSVASANGEARGVSGWRKELTYLGRSYVLRKLLQCDSREVSTADASPTPDVEDNNQDPLHPQYEGSEFPRLVGFLGEEECSLDALLESEREPSVSEQELEQEEAWRLLRCWFGVGEFLCLHESASSIPQSPGVCGPRLSLEQLLSTGVVAMEHRRCAAVLALQPPGNGRRGFARKGVSVKGHAALSQGASGWTRLAETVRMESKTSSNVPQSRQSLEAFGELLEDKALSAWGKVGEGGRLYASARYTWERRVYDGRTLGEGDDAWQTEWRTRARRERSHRRRGPRDRAVRSLLAATEGEGLLPAWGTEEDPLEGIRMTALWRGIGGEHPLPHAPLELIGDLSGGLSAAGIAADWKATVSWESGDARGAREGSLGFKLRLLLAVYVQSLALGGDLLMADVGNSGNEADVSSAREGAMHIGAVLGPGTRALIAQMRATTQHNASAGGDGDVQGADPAEIVHSVRYLLTPRRASLSYRDTQGASKSGRGSWDSQDHRQHQQQQAQTPTSTPPKETPSRTKTPLKGNEQSLSPLPWPPAAVGGRSPGFDTRAYAIGGTDGGGSIGRIPPRGECGVDGAVADGGATPWLWVPRGGAPACRLVSQVALEAARFGTHGVCLGDVAAFWKSFVQELRFLWEEGACVPRMDPEPPVDGYSMYDPSATGQDAAGSARLRRHMTAAVDAADGARWNTEVCGQSGSAQGDCKQGDDGGGDFARPRSVSSGGTGGTSGTAFSPPPPDMRTCLIHQKLQMLNCCVAEQNRARVVALSTRSSPVGLTSASAASWGAPHVNACGGPETGARGEPSGELPRDEQGGAGLACFPPPSALERSETDGFSATDVSGGGVSGGDGGGGVGVGGGDVSGGDGVGGVGGGGGGGGGGSGCYNEGSAANEGVAAAMPSETVGKTGSSRGEDDGGNGAVDPGKSGARDSEKTKVAAFAAERDAILRRVGVKKEGNGGGKATGRRWWGIGGGPKETTEPSPTLPPSHLGAGDGDDAQSNELVDLPRAPGKVGGAVRRVGGTLKRVGVAVRKAGGAVNKARLAARENAATQKGDTLEERSVEGRETLRDGRGDWEVGSTTIPAAVVRGSRENHGVAATAVADATASMKFTGDRLLVTDEWVLVPELMQTCPLTSDMLEQQMELVRRLSVRAGSNGADADVSRNRLSRLRFATLLADMRCFVRENPGAVFADFVRWYSPRNWVGGSAQQHDDAGLKNTGLEYHESENTGAEKAGRKDAVLEDAGVENAALQDADGGVTVELLSRISDVEDAMRALVVAIVDRAANHAADVPACAAATTTTAAVSHTATASSALGTAATTATIAAAAAATTTITTTTTTTTTTTATATDAISNSTSASGTLGTTAGVSEATAAPGAVGTAMGDEDATRADLGGALQSRGGTDAMEAANAGAEPAPLPPSSPPATRSAPPMTSEVSSSGWKTIIPRKTVATQPSPSLSRSASRACSHQLDWGRRGKVEWRSAAEVAAAAADGSGSCGVDEKEGNEWMEAWFEVERAVAEENEEGGVSRPRNLFSPAQEAEKALHYLETIGPAQLMGQLVMALACTSGFLLSEAQTDALELPCVQAALSRVNLAVQSASEGLHEASSGGGVLLMGNRVAHPISQATLVACDALCDAVDDAEVLLSRGTSLLHKLPGEYGLVEALVTANSTSGRHNASAPKVGEPAISGFGRCAGDGGLEALVRYLSSGNPSPPFSSPGGSPLPLNEDGSWLQQRQQQEEGHHEEQSRDQGQRHHQEQMHRQRAGISGSNGRRVVYGELRAGDSRGSGDNSARDGTDGDDHHAAVESNNSASQTAASTAAAATSPTTTPTRGARTPSTLLSTGNAMPEARVREYSAKWRLPGLASDLVRKMKRTGENDDSDLEGVGARLYARVTTPGSGVSAGEDEEGGVETDVRLAISVAEPASMVRL